MTDFELAILSLVGENNGEWGWYQLDRGLNLMKFDYEPDLLEIIARLEGMGYMRSEKVEGLPQPRYWITDKGRELTRASTAQEPRSDPGE